MEREILEMLGVFVIGAPLLALSVRLAIRPILNAVLDIGTAIETLSASRPSSESVRVAQLEEEVQELRLQLQRANDGLHFERSLHGGTPRQPSAPVA